MSGLEGSRKAAGSYARGRKLSSAKLPGRVTGDTPGDTLSRTGKLAQSGTGAAGTAAAPLRGMAGTEAACGPLPETAQALAEPRG